MIEFARRENSAPNIQYFEDDAQTFGDHHSDWSEKFNKILCLTVLHWCKDDERALKNIFHCLKPGGTFILGFSLKTQLCGKTSCYGETGDMWVRNHPRWGLFLKVTIFYKLSFSWIRQRKMYFKSLKHSHDSSYKIDRRDSFLFFCFYVSSAGQFVVLNCDAKVIF